MTRPVWPPEPRDERRHAPHTPLYEHLVLEVTEALFANPPKDGKMPPEPELSKRFAVSRTTLRRALKEMETRGLVVRRPGLGTFFMGGNPLPASASYGHDGRLSARAGVQLECLAIEPWVPGGPESESATDAVFGDRPLLHIRRLDSVSRTGISVVDAFVPADLLATPTPSVVESQSVYATLENAGIRVRWARQRIWAEEFDTKDAQLLGVKPNDPALVIELLTYSDGDSPVEMALLRFRQQIVRLEMTLSRLERDVRLDLVSRGLDAVGVRLAETATGPDRPDPKDSA